MCPSWKRPGRDPMLERCRLMSRTPGSRGVGHNAWDAPYESSLCPGCCSGGVADEYSREELIR